MRQEPFRVEVRHDGLNKYRLIQHRDPFVAQQMAQAQIAQWNEQWNKKQSQESSARSKEEKKALATSRTKEAQRTLSDLSQILVQGVTKVGTFDWNGLKNLSSFSDLKPSVKEPEKLPHTATPIHPKFVEPQFSILEKLFPKSKVKKIEAAQWAHSQQVATWELSVKRIKEHNDEIDRTNAANMAKYQEAIKSAEQTWELARRKFYSDQAEQHKKVDQLRDLFCALDPEAIEWYFDNLLSCSEYPDFFPNEHSVYYSPKEKILMVDLRMPAPEDIPRIKEVRYVTTTDQFNQIQMSETAFNSLYDSILYQQLLRTVFEMLAYDSQSAIDMVAVNGWVRGVESSTGKVIQPCVMSIAVSKKDIADLDFKLVEPKSCFRKLKGVSAAKLVGLAAVAPVMNLNRHDSRFVPSYDVGQNLNDDTNLASMHWEDFEHLVRELFEKEFAINGGEVRVTQASRDGGVDAVVFDPDPLRGGKIVIQAKRYTNVVGVGAVRDLYGTLMNEGANKGILVSTSQFGPDAYEFARGKPLTLLNGENLLHLLSKHGYKASINIAEAKKQLQDANDKS